MAEEKKTDKTQEPLFVHLRVYSTYSLLTSTLTPEEIVQFAVKNHMPAIALTDLSNLFGALEFSECALSQGVQPIVGTTLTVIDVDKNFATNVVILAQNQEGYENLMHLSGLSYQNLRHDPQHGPHVTLHTLRDSAAGLILLIGGNDGVVKPVSVDQLEYFVRALMRIFLDRLYLEIQRYEGFENAEYERRLLRLSDAHRIPLVASSSAYFLDETMYEAHDALLCVSDGRYVTEESRRRSRVCYGLQTAMQMQERFADIPSALQNSVNIAKRCAVCARPRPISLPKYQSSFQDEETAIRSLSQEGLKAKEQQDFSQFKKKLFVAGHWALPLFEKREPSIGSSVLDSLLGSHVSDVKTACQEELLLALEGCFLSEEYKAAELLAFSEETDSLQECSRSLLSGDIWGASKITVGSSSVDQDALMELLKDAEAQCEAVLPSVRDAMTNRAIKQVHYQRRLLYELGVIERIGYAGYFLIVADFVGWSKANGVPVGPGRGSGAGSLVAYTLGITDIDPIRFGLLFERFLNPERVSMPDLDIDFCQNERVRVVEYVREKYGSDCVAQIITFGKLQARAVLRDVGRVIGLPYSKVDAICRMIPNNPARPVTLQEAIDLDVELRSMCQEDQKIADLIAMSLKLEGLYRHVSTHAAGVVISDTDLRKIVPLYYDQEASEHMDAVLPTTQYSMKYVELSGLIKFDFLGLKTLTLIQAVCHLIEAKTGEAIDIANIALHDKHTYALLGKGETIGVFQLESYIMQNALKTLQPDALEDIIALISLNRPGPMAHIATYIRRKHGLEEVVYPDPMLESILSETFGVIIYQEQVMSIAQTLSGYTLAAADILRRAMGKKIKSEMESQKERFIQGAVDNKVSRKKAVEIFEIVAKFAGYGFNKSHATAYAILSYQTAWLKANYQLEFFVACLNMEILNTNKIQTFIIDAEKRGVGVLPPSVNDSAVYFAAEKGRIRYSLAALKGVGMAAAESIVRARQKACYRDVFDFLERVDAKAMNKKVLESLIKAGALDTVHAHRAQLMANMTMLLKLLNRSMQEESSLGQFSFLSQDMSDVALDTVSEWHESERLMSEFEAIGFYLTSNPLSLYGRLLRKLKLPNLHDILTRLEESSVAVFVLGVKMRGGKGSRFVALSLSDRTGVCEAYLYDDQIIEQNRDLLRAGQCFIVRILCKKREDSIRFVVTSLKTIQRYLEEYHWVMKIMLTPLLEVEVLQGLLEKVSHRAGRVKIVLMLRVNGESGPRNLCLPLPYAARYCVDVMRQVERLPGVISIEVQQKTGLYH